MTRLKVSHTNLHSHLCPAFPCPFSLSVCFLPPAPSTLPVSVSHHIGCHSTSKFRSEQLPLPAHARTPPKGIYYCQPFSTAARVDKRRNTRTLNMDIGTGLLKSRNRNPVACKESFMEVSYDDWRVSRYYPRYLGSHLLYQVGVLFAKRGAWCLSAVA